MTLAQTYALLRALASDGHHGSPCGLQRRTKSREAYLEGGGRSREGVSLPWLLTDAGRAAANALRPKPYL